MGGGEFAAEIYNLGNFEHKLMEEFVC